MFSDLWIIEKNSGYSLVEATTTLTIDTNLLAGYFTALNTLSKFRRICSRRSSVYFQNGRIVNIAGKVIYQHWTPEIDIYATQTLGQIAWDFSCIYQQDILHHPVATHTFHPYAKKLESYIQVNVIDLICYQPENEIL